MSGSTNFVSKNSYCGIQVQGSIQEGVPGVRLNPTFHRELSFFMRIQIPLAFAFSSLSNFLPEVIMGKMERPEVHNFLQHSVETIYISTDKLREQGK